MKGIIKTYSRTVTTILSGDDEEKFNDLLIYYSQEVSGIEMSVSAVIRMLVRKEHDKLMEEGKIFKGN